MAGQSNNNRIGQLEDRCAHQSVTINQLLERLAKAEAAIKELEDVVLVKMANGDPYAVQIINPVITTPPPKQWVPKVIPVYDPVLG